MTAEYPYRKSSLPAPRFAQQFTKLSIVIPVYNECRTIEKLCREYSG